MQMNADIFFWKKTKWKWIRSSYTRRWSSCFCCFMVYKYSFAFAQLQSRLWLCGCSIVTTLIISWRILWISSQSIYSFGNLSNWSVVGNRMICGGLLSFSSKLRDVSLSRSSPSLYITFSSVIFRSNFISPFCGSGRLLTCKSAISILESCCSNDDTSSLFQHLALDVSIREDIYVKTSPPRQTLCQWAVRRIQVVCTIQESMKRMTQYFLHLVSVIFLFTI